MALNLEDIAGHPALHRGVRAQALALLQAYEANPRLASVFATQQRWLMAHDRPCPALQARPDDYRKELTIARFIDMIRQHSVASRNTADAFVKEMLHYNFIQYRRRARTVASALCNRRRPQWRRFTAGCSPICRRWTVSMAQTGWPGSLNGPKCLPHCSHRWRTACFLQSGARTQTDLFLVHLA